MIWGKICNGGRSAMVFQHYCRSPGGRSAMGDVCNITPAHMSQSLTATRQGIQPSLSAV